MGRTVWLELGREMILLWVAQAKVQMKFSLAIVHKEVQPGLACTTRPHIDNVFNVLEEESLFRVTEGNHDAIDSLHKIFSHGKYLKKSHHQTSASLGFIEQVKFEFFEMYNRVKLEYFLPLNFYSSQARVF